MTARGPAITRRRVRTPLNWAMLGEAVLAVLVTQMDVFNRLLGTTQLNLRQFGWALIPAIALLLLWELGKYIARRRISDRSGGAPVIPQRRPGSQQAQVDGPLEGRRA